MLAVLFRLSFANNLAKKSLSRHNNALLCGYLWLKILVKYKGTANAMIDRERVETKHEYAAKRRTYFSLMCIIYVIGVQQTVGATELLSETIKIELIRVFIIVCNRNTFSRKIL